MRMRTLKPDECESKPTTQAKASNKQLQKFRPTVQKRIMRKGGEENHVSADKATLPSPASRKKRLLMTNDRPLGAEGEIVRTFAQIKYENSQHERRRGT